MTAEQTAAIERLRRIKAGEHVVDVRKAAGIPLNEETAT